MVTCTLINFQCIKRIGGESTNLSPYITELRDEAEDHVVLLVERSVADLVPVLVNC